MSYIDEKRKILASNTSQFFTRHLSQRGFSGYIKFDHNRESLELIVSDCWNRAKPEPDVSTTDVSSALYAVHLICGRDIRMWTAANGFSGQKILASESRLVWFSFLLVEKVAGVLPTSHSSKWNIRERQALNPSVPSGWFVQYNWRPA